MWLNRFSPRSEYVRFRPNKSIAIQKKFQVKYTLFLTGSVFFALCISIVPLFYFFRQNYQIFSNLAYQHAPNLLEHLERELSWLNFFLLSISAFTLIFCWIFGMKSTAKIIGPVLVLQNHIKSLTKGDWAVNEVAVKESDEFRDFVSSYNYLYHSIRQVTTNDLNRLKQLSIDPENRIAHQIWQEMIREKSEQLGLLEETNATASDHDASLLPLHDSRHAS